MPLTDTIDAIQRELRIEARPETVFGFFTEQEKMLRWMGRAVTADPRPGGVLRMDYNGFDIMRGQFLEVTPCSRIVFSWGWETLGDGTRPGQSTVEVTLTPEGSGTLLRLTHSGLSEMDRASHGEGWDMFLPMLVTAVESGTTASEPPSLTESEELASRLNSQLVILRESLEACPPDAGSVPCAGTGWPARVTANHVIAHLGLVPFAIATAAGERAPQADFTTDALDAYNADFAAQHANATVGEALASLKKEGPAAVEALKAMDPATLGNALPMVFAGGAPLSARQLIQGPLLANLEEHIAEIRQAMAAATS